MPGRRGAAAPGRTLVPAISAVMLARRVAKGSSMGSGLRPPRCRPVLPPSPTAPGAYHLTGAPLDVTEWCASSALDVAEWHESRHMRSCQKILCHSMPPGGTPIAHSAPPSGTAKPRKRHAKAAGCNALPAEERYSLPRSASFAIPRHSRRRLLGTYHGSMPPLMPVAPGMPSLWAIRVARKT